MIEKLILKIKYAARHSFDGLKLAFQNEFAFQIEVGAFIIALPALFFFGHTAVERILLMSAFFLVFIAELLNTAIEITLDRLDTHWNPLTKKAKDLSSAAVMMAIINAVAVWGFIIISHT